jgi:hypothetical protein
VKSHLLTAIWVGLVWKDVSKGQFRIRVKVVLQGVPVIAASIRLLVGLGGAECPRELEDE